MQALFDWCDSHKHQFALPAADYPSNSPIDSILWDPTSRRFRDGTIVLETWHDVDACHEDERAVTVGELLPTVKARLVYGYDFGDSWDHLIRVESIEPAVQANTSELPRCTGGRCAAPVEDSGGCITTRGWWASI